MRRLAALLAALLTLAACTPYGSGNPDGPPSWRLAWADEFDGTSLNAANWSTGWYGGCNPVQSDERAGFAPSQVRVADGSLNLDAIARTNTCNGTTRPYLSGMVTSRGKRTLLPPVYIEARVDLEGAGGQVANWPAFWTNADRWPLAELDIMEGLGQAAQTWHGPDDGGAGHRVANFGITTGWHVYGALWEPGRVTAYLDGHKAGTYASSNVTSTYPAWVIIGHQIGKWGGPEKVPATMSVDWLRAWRP